MIQEKLRDLIETKLNDNTQSKKFIVGSYIYNDDTQQHFIYNVSNGYKLIEKNYIPAMIDFSGEYQPIPNEINGTAEIGIEFLINAEDKVLLDEDLATIEELISKVLGNYEQFTIGSTTYNSVWTMGLLVPAGVTTPINGYYFTRVVTTITIDFSNTNVYGNAYTYELDGNQISMVDGSNGRENEEDYPHNLGETEAKGGVSESRWSLTFQAYVNSYLQTNFVDKIMSSSYDMTKVYTLTQKKNGTVINTVDIQITSISAPILLGEKLYITISMMKSDVANS